VLDFGVEHDVDAVGMQRRRDRIGDIAVLVTQQVRTVLKQRDART
jgi:hypothetical protein